MNEQTKLHDDSDTLIEQTEQQTPHAGDLLRKQRLSLGMSQKQVAERLRLRESIIVSIDKNEFDLGQVDTFVKGYLRSYAKAVNLNEDEVLAAYEQHNQSAANDSAMQSFSRKTKREKSDNNLMRLTYVIGAVLIGISLLWWWQSQQKNALVIEPEFAIETATVSEELGEIEQPTASEVTPVIASNEPASPSIDREAQQLAAQQAENAQLEEAELAATEPQIEEPVVEETTAQAEPVQLPAEPVETAAVDEPQAAEPAAPQETASNNLFMNFTADCWIQVKDATGKVLATGVKKAGDNITLAGEKPYNIILGAPEGVEMRLASEPIDLSGYTAGKVARLTLP